ncbi:NgoMIV family type II restriction endonuclease [Jannaschia pohangensis]|uniref:NgoMIV restriction enzyme n=1 Tax=Jannaschia pohangensis TaxID=390807 RepID=A0A1I3JIE3_9RHOB|nr:NgoMIV family type II restriction endonuclease [Jannaschia pohangensis]SFI59944.1 NgoMIV restriction enzyme [Jannaschia pohangensis]
MTVFADLRRQFHATLLAEVLTLSGTGVASNADKSSKWSRMFAAGIIERIGHAAVAPKLAGQTSGARFEVICAQFLTATQAHLTHLRPGRFEVEVGGHIARFRQYAHLDELEAIARSNREIATALGSDYLIKPDILISRQPEGDRVINAHAALVDWDVAGLSDLRAGMTAMPLLHASVSCKWTLRSDRAQNARSEGLNLVRNRKGPLPHIVVVTGEPLPSRIASLALGTGDIDCVYHFALPELRDVLTTPGNAAYLETLDMMVEGGRLKDISDLPLDLVS